MDSVFDCKELDFVHIARERAINSALNHEQWVLIRQKQTEELDLLKAEISRIGVELPEVLTRKEAMDYLRVSSDKLFELTAPVGPIPVYREGSKLMRYRLSDLRSHVESGLTTR